MVLVPSTRCKPPTIVFQYSGTSLRSSGCPTWLVCRILWTLGVTSIEHLWISHVNGGRGLMNFQLEQEMVALKLHLMNDAGSILSLIKGNEWVSDEVIVMYQYNYMLQCFIHTCIYYYCISSYSSTRKQTCQLNTLA